MSKCILISIKPKYVKDILNGVKTLEIRKSIPKCDLPIDVYIYCTKDKKYANLVNRGGFLTGMVVAKFTLKETKTIYTIYFPNEYFYKATDLTKEQLEEKSSLGQVDLDQYLRKKKGYAWVINNLEIFDKPKEVNEYFKWEDKKIEWFTGLPKCRVMRSLTRAPQSYCFIEV